MRKIILFATFVGIFAASGCKKIDCMCTKKCKQVPKKWGTQKTFIPSWGDPKPPVGILVVFSTATDVWQVRENNLMKHLSNGQVDTAYGQKAAPSGWPMSQAEYYSYQRSQTRFVYAYPADNEGCCPTIRPVRSFADLAQRTSVLAVLVHDASWLVSTRCEIAEVPIRFLGDTAVIAGRPSGGQDTLKIVAPNKLYSKWMNGLGHAHLSFTMDEGGEGNWGQSGSGYTLQWYVKE